MEINYWAILACAALSMVTGAIWYGPLFGKTWMRVLKINPEDLARRKEMQAKAGPLYLVQFLLSLFQIWALAHFLQGWGLRTQVPPPSSLENAVVIWAAFIMPTIAGSCMWNNDSAKVSWTKFGLQAGYQLVNFVLFAFILGMWM